MDHKILSSSNDLVKVKCSGSLENTRDLSFMENIRKDNKSVLLIMEDLDYVNSCGFGALVEETMNFDDDKLKVKIKKLEPHVRKTLAILGGEQLLNYLD